MQTPQIFQDVRKYIAQSCGSAGVDAGTGVHPNAVSVMKEIGIDISNQESKAIDATKIDEYDFIREPGRLDWLNQCSLRCGDGGSGE